MITAQDAAILSLNNEDLQEELAGIESQIKDAAIKGRRRITVQASKAAIITFRKTDYDITTQPGDDALVPTMVISW